MNEQLATIRARREAVTPGVWSVRVFPEQIHGSTFDSPSVWSGETFVCDCGTGTGTAADAAFIAAAPGDVDTLLTLVERLQQLQSGARKDIEYLQHDGATWKGLFEDMRQKCDTARAERDALTAQLAQAQRELAQTTDERDEEWATRALGL